MNRLLDFAFRFLGWRLLVLNGDPLVFDRWRFVRSTIRRGGARTLDAGSGNGGFSLFSAAQGNPTVGLTSLKSEVQRANRRSQACGSLNASFRQVDLRELSNDELATGDQFDQIICLEVIEHVLDDQRLLNTLGRMLRPGGQLLLSTPTLEHVPLRYEKLSAAEDGGHVRWGYAADGLRHQLELAGLDVRSVDARSGIVAQVITDIGRAVGARFGTATGWAATLPLRPLVVFDVPLTRWTGRPWHCLTAVAVRAND